MLEPLITDDLLLYTLAGHQWLCSHAPLNWTLGPTVRGALELRQAVHHAVGITRQRNSGYERFIRRSEWPSYAGAPGYRSSRVNIMAKVSPLPIPPLALRVSV